MIISSNYADVPLTETDLFSFLFCRSDRQFPDSQAIFHDAEQPTRSYTYLQLRDAALSFARGLKQHFHLEKGQTVGMFAVNDVEIPPAVLGTILCGGIVSPANPAYTETELVHQLRDSQVKVLLTDSASLTVVKEACKKIGLPLDRILLLGTGRDHAGRTRHWTEICIIQSKSKTLFEVIKPKDDVAFLVYSSGTTGLPKGVLLTHYNITSNIQQTQGFETITWDGSRSVEGIPDTPKGRGDKILACLPFFHIYGLTSMMINPIYTGVCCVVAQGFELEKWCRSVQDHKITIAYIVPPIVVLLAKSPVVDKYDLSSLRISTSGAAPLAKDMIDNVYERLGVRIKQGYGMSETAPTLFTMRWCDWNKKSGSAGWLVPNVQAKFCRVPDEEDTDGPVQELARGEIGELHVRGPNVFKGYHRNEKATSGSFYDGWFRTGDVGFMDQDGDLFITDRAKELIKYKGFQIAPAELEGLLLGNDLVEDVAVIGVPQPDLGTEVPRAYVVRRGGLTSVHPTDGEKIIIWLASKVVGYKRLRGGVRFVEAIPKSGSGKILRKILKEEIRKEAEEDRRQSRAKL